MSDRTVIDLSHPIADGIPMFPGLPGPEIESHLTRAASRAHYAGGTEFVIHRYNFIGNTGTYLDAPFHRHADGSDLVTLPIARLVDLPGLVLDVRPRVDAGERAVDAADVAVLDVAGRALLIHTGWAARWPGPDYLAPNPYLTERAARLLADRNVALVGIDAWNVDDTGDGRRRPVHTILLRAEIPIVENLRGLDRLPHTGFRFHAAPLPIQGGSACPIRAYAILEGDSRQATGVRNGS